MNTNYKLLALDMDGTLLNDEHRISDATVHWIQKAVEQGIHVCLSTGRAFSEAYEYAEQLKLATPMVTVNGSEVWRAPHTLYRRALLDVNLVRKMQEIGERAGIWYWAYAVDQIYNRDRWSANLEEQEWLKFGYTTEDEELRHQVMMELQKLEGLEITNSSPINLEINPQGINKATGIRQVCELLGITMDQVVAVGDSMNDLAVIQQAGLGVAMGNAQEVVKEVADQVVSSNNEDGIVEVIKNYILS